MNRQPTPNLEQAVALTIIFIGLALLLPNIVKAKPIFNLNVHIGIEQGSN